MNAIPVHLCGQPFFSVIVRSYNRAYILPRALESLLAQTETDFEVLIVDDGSSDDTFAIARAYSQKMPTLRYLYHPNKGVAYASNTGIAAAVGRYITWLDSDDYYHPDHLASRRTILEADPDLEFLHGGIEIIGDVYVPDKYDPSKRVSLHDCPVGGTFVTAREMTVRLGGFPIVKFGVDSGFLETAQAAGIRIEKINTPQTYIYDRTSPDSVLNIVKQGGFEALDAYRRTGKLAPD